MTSYRRRQMDDSLIFSLDFAGQKLEDNYAIEEQQRGFILTDKRSVCRKEGGLDLAIAVSSHMSQDLVVLLDHKGTLWFE